MDSVEWLVIGGRGLVGSAIVEGAADRRVAWTWHRGQPRGEMPGDSSFRLDLTDEAAVHALMSRLRPRVVFNAAVASRRDDAPAVTTEGAAFAAAAARAVDAAFVHLSTDMVFDGTSGPYDEAATPSPITAYGAAKAEAEALVRAAHPEAIIVRLPLLYSIAPLDHGLGAWLARCALGLGYPLFVDEIRCPAHAADVAASLVGVGRALGGDDAWPAPPRVMHLPGPRALSRLEFGRLVLAALSHPPEWAVPGFSRDADPPRPREIVLLARRTPAPYLAPLRPPEVALLARPINSARPTPPTPPAGR